MSAYSRQIRLGCFSQVSYKYTNTDCTFPLKTKHTSHASAEAVCITCESFHQYKAHTYAHAYNPEKQIYNNVRHVYSNLARCCKHMPWSLQFLSLILVGQITFRLLLKFWNWIKTVSVEVKTAFSPALFFGFNLSVLLYYSALSNPTPPKKNP